MGTGRSRSESASENRGLGTIGSTRSADATYTKHETGTISQKTKRWVMSEVRCIGPGRWRIVLERGEMEEGNIFSRGHCITNESGTSETRQTHGEYSWSSYVLLRPPSFRPYGHGILERPSRICRKYLYSLNMKPSRFPPSSIGGQQSWLSPHGVSFVFVQAR